MPSTTESSHEIRLLIADDHHLIHGAVTSITEKEGFRVVHLATTWTDAVDAYGSVRPDVVLLDINIPPDNGGLVAARQILSLDPTARIVAFSAGGDPRIVQEALDAGCLGFLSKTADPKEVPVVLRQAFKREQALDNATARSLIRSLQNRMAARRELQLTDRELAILAFMADGLSNTEIAAELHLSRSTVANSLSPLFEKLEVTDRTAAAIAAVRRGLIA